MLCSALNQCCKCCSRWEPYDRDSLLEAWAYDRRTRETQLVQLVHAHLGWKVCVCVCFKCVYAHIVFFQTESHLSQASLEFMVQAWVTLNF